MKSRSIAVITLAAVIGFFSCKKDIQVCSGNNVYSKWFVSTITQKGYVFPKGLTYDTTYNAQATDYIDLSQKGVIVFYINQQQHTDTYDTTKYNLLTDTLVAVTNSENPNNTYVALMNAHTNNPTLEERSFGIDTESETFYDLKQ